MQRDENYFDLNPLTRLATSRRPTPAVERAGVLLFSCLAVKLIHTEDQIAG